MDPTSTWRPLTMIISIKGHLLYGKKDLHERRGRRTGREKRGGRGELTKEEKKKKKMRRLNKGGEEDGQTRG